ncbi:hypothetical protein PVAP13_8KG232201 [Panicum virgatum]|uniref:Uncharacterized protein n=1 Tax=Panicum virgatum TaxID=38727 RepID=A0A8T0PI54_PANVG|nr:hypothetical protein PVAP13_8KG232201 [Panicum virgatum]
MGGYGRPGGVTLPQSPCESRPLRRQAPSHFGTEASEQVAAGAPSSSQLQRLCNSPSPPVSFSSLRPADVLPCLLVSLAPGPFFNLNAGLGCLVGQPIRPADSVTRRTGSRLH